jgi:hypothetical protein
LPYFWISPSRGAGYAHAGDSAIFKEYGMSNDSPSLEELERRIAIVRDNIRQLIEQAAAFSGAEDEDRAADRIAQQQEELDRLTQQRDALRKT